MFVKPIDALHFNEEVVTLKNLIVLYENLEGERT
jgi:hypothetical protein